MKKIKKKGWVTGSLIATLAMVFVPMGSALADSTGSSSSGSSGGSGHAAGHFSTWAGKTNNVNDVKKGLNAGAGNAITSWKSISGATLDSLCNTAVKEAQAKGGGKASIVAAGISYDGNMPYGADKNDFLKGTSSVNGKISKFFTPTKYKASLAGTIQNRYKNEVAKRAASGGNPDMVCVAATKTELKPPEFSFSKNYNKTLSEEINGVCNENISLNKQIMARGNLSPWKNQTKTQKTRYGDALSQIIGQYQGNDLTGQKDTLRKKLLDAIAADKASPREIKIDMTDENQKALADGGVVNVIKNAQSCSANISDNRTGTINFVRCKKGKVGDAIKRADQLFAKPGMTRAEIESATATLKSEFACDTSGSKHNTNLKITSSIPKTPKPVSFWQMISVHCNKEGFENLYKSVSGATIINTGDESKKISAVMHSKEYVTAPPRLDFGQPGTPSGNVGFYDKECPYDCTADPNTAEAGKNGAKDNIRDTVGENKTTKEISGLYGAKSGEINGNNLTFFRDNDPKDIDIDLWYPIKGGSGVVDYDGRKAVTTTVTRLNSGTPDVVTSSTQGGKFTMNAVDGKNSYTLFSGDNGNPDSQMNWDTSTNELKTTSIKKGQFTKFNVAASWASEKDHPQVLNFKWEFNPFVKTNIPTKNIGFTKDNNKDVGTITTVPREIEGKCYANFGTEGSKDTLDLFQENTGTGTVNEIDKGPLEGNGPEISTNLIINFVRASTE